MARILAASVTMLLLLGCGQATSRSLISAQPSHPRAVQGRSDADYALAATVQGVGGAWYHVPSHGVSESVWSALWDHAALTPALRTASESLLQALLGKMDILAYNIANAETIGFKHTRVFIETQTRKKNDGFAEEGSEVPIPSEGTPIAGVRATVRTDILFDQGSALQAGNLDAMIQGDGFFQVKLPDERIGYLCSLGALESDRLHAFGPFRAERRRLDYARRYAGTSAGGYRADTGVDIEPRRVDRQQRRGVWP